MKSQVRSEIGSRFGKHESFGPPGMLLSSQRVVGPASQRRLFAPRKTFTFHGSRRKTNVSMKTDNLSLGNSLCADASHRRKLTPASAADHQRPKPTILRNGQQVSAATTHPSCPPAPSVAQQCRLAADLAVPFVQPQLMLAQHMVSGSQLMDAGNSKNMATEFAAQVTGIDEDAQAARAWMTDRPFSAREAYLAGKRRIRRQRRPKPVTSKPFRKIFFSEREGKWIEHRIFESELKTTNDLSGPQPFPKTNPARRRRNTAEMGRPHKVKGRKTSKMREMLPTAFVKGGEKPDQPCRKIDITDQLRMELYKRNMPVVPTSYQQHIYKFGKPPFRGNPRTH